MVRCGLGRVWGLFSILEGENPGAAVSLVLSQPTEPGSELGVGSQSYSFSCACPGVLSIASLTLGYYKVDSVSSLQGSKSPSPSCDLWKRQRLPAVTSLHGAPDGWLSLDLVGASRCNKQS